MSEYSDINFGALNNRALHNANDQRIAVYGGSFNPPHLGHVFMCMAVLQTQAIDEVWVLPCADHPFKSDLEPFGVRVDMCQRAFRHVPKAKVLTIETYLPQPNYTVQTLEALTEHCTRTKFSYVIGGDLVEEIPDWKHADGITDLAQFIVVPRQGHPVIDAPDVLGDYQEVELGFQLPELSSSRIQKMMRRGADVSGFLDRRVLEYIRKYELYH